MPSVLHRCSAVACGIGTARGSPGSGVGLCGSFCFEMAKIISCGILPWKTTGGVAGHRIPKNRRGGLRWETGPICGSSSTSRYYTTASSDDGHDVASMDGIALEGPSVHTELESELPEIVVGDQIGDVHRFWLPRDDRRGVGPVLIVEFLPSMGTRAKALSPNEPAALRMMVHATANGRCFRGWETSGLSAGCMVNFRTSGIGLMPRSHRLSLTQPTYSAGPAVLIPDPAIAA